MHSQVLKEQLTKTRFVGLNFSFMCVKPSLLAEADTPRSRHNLGVSYKN